VSELTAADLGEVTTQDEEDPLSASRDRESITNSISARELKALGLGELTASYRASLFRRLEAIRSARLEENHHLDPVEVDTALRADLELAAEEILRRIHNVRRYGKGRTR